MSWRKLRFSLIALALLVLLVAGFFAGYRRGYERGFIKVAENVAYTEIYPVADLVTRLQGEHTTQPEVEYDTLIQLIQTAVLPRSWDEVHVIRPIKETRQLAVSHTSEGHRAVTRLIAQLREPLNQFRRNAAAGTCPYCGNAPLAEQLGDPCAACDTPLHRTTEPTPASLVVRP